MWKEIKWHNDFWGKFAFLVSFTADPFLFINETVSSVLKLISIAMFSLLILSSPLPKTIIKYSFVLFLILGIGILISFSTTAGLQEFYRYLLPIIILLFGFSRRNSIREYFNLLIVIAILNDIFQLLLYLIFPFNILPSSFFAIADSIEGFTLLRGSGFFGFGGVMLFAIMNFSSYYLCKLYYPHKKKLKAFFLIFFLLSLSFKLIAAFIVIIILFQFRKFSLKKKVLFLIGSISLIAILTPYLGGMISSRLNYYILEGNSARFESYRVMFEAIPDNIFWGEGLGSFGGPASVDFNSPIYNKYNFNWYGLEGALATTDTFFPHIFVELGLLGGIYYLLSFFLPLASKSYKHSTPEAKRTIKILLTAIFIDSLFSFGLNSIVYLLCSIFFFYGILNSNMSPSKLVPNESN